MLQAEAEGWDTYLEKVSTLQVQRPTLFVYMLRRIPITKNDLDQGMRSGHKQDVTMSKKYIHSQETGVRVTLLGYVWLIDGTYKPSYNNAKMLKTNENITSITNGMMVLITEKQY